MKGSEIVETLGFTPGRQPAPFKGLAPSLAAQAALQDISIGRLRLPELRVLSSGSPVQAIRATHREGWLGPQSRPAEKGQLHTDRPERQVGGQKPHCPLTEGLLLSLAAGVRFLLGQQYFLRDFLAGEQGDGATW